MSKIIYIGSRAEYQPPQVAMPVVRAVALPEDDDHYLFPGIMRAYLTWIANKYLIGMLMCAVVQRATDFYYASTTRMLIKYDHNKRIFKWYVLPVLRKAVENAGKAAYRRLRKAVEPVISAWEWRKDLYRG